MCRPGGLHYAGLKTLDRRGDVMVALNTAQNYPGASTTAITPSYAMYATSRDARSRIARALISLATHLKLDRDLALTRARRNQDHIRRSCLISDHIPPDQHQEFGATWP